jgi:ribosomal-protein-alanine N-acetyltransferase
MAEETDFRLAFVVDAPELAAMSRDLVEIGLGWSWVPSRIARHVRSEESVVLVAQRRAQIAGFAIMRFGVEQGHLDLLAVRPKYRRAGLGRKMVVWLEESALTAGVSVIYLEVRAGNDAALAFYEALGYRRIKRVPGYYSGREAAICMARDLWCSSLTSAT